MPIVLFDTTKKPRGSDKQHDRHEYKYDHMGCFWVNYLGHAFHNANAETGHTGTNDRSKSTDHDHRKNNDYDVGSHPRAYLISRRREHPGESRERDAKPIVEGYKPRYIDTKGLHKGWILRPCSQIETEPCPLNRKPDADTNRWRKHNDPDAI